MGADSAPKVKDQMRVRHQAQLRFLLLLDTAQSVAVVRVPNADVLWSPPATMSRVRSKRYRHAQQQTRWRDDDRLEWRSGRH